MEYKLIEAVQMHPCLFDKSKQEYRNKLKKEKAWASVSTATGATLDHCQSRWRSLRDRYVRETVSARPKSGAAADEKRKWCYTDAMSFLQKHVAPRRTLSNMSWSEQESWEETEEVDFLNDSSSCSLANSTMVNSCLLEENANSVSTEEEISCNKSSSSSNRSEKRRKIQVEAHEKFDQLCGALSNLIATKRDNTEKSRNADFFKVLDSYLLKHSEEEQDKLKIEILNLVYQER